MTTSPAARAASEARAALLSRMIGRMFGEAFPDAVQVDRTQRAVEQPIAGAARFAPDHSPMVRPRIALKAGFEIGLDDFRHVERAVGRAMRGLMKIARGINLHVTQVCKMNPATRAELAHQCRNIVLQVRA